jgi:2-polyprenyl-6-methoxyphenol hydroxylase-like FAD-dependent oxidoreductase
VRLGIVGAGPAGLTAALAARALGLAPVLFEQAVDFRRVGGGIAIQPNGLRALEALGLLDGLRPRMQAVEGVVVERADGVMLSRFDYGSLALPRRQLAIIARADLQEHLAAAGIQRGVPVHFNHRCVAVSRAAAATVLRFANGAEHECDVVIAADGLGSTVRKLLGLRARVRALGWGALRGTVELKCPASLIREIWGPDGRLFGIAPLPRARTYFYCSAPVGRWPAILNGGLPDWIASWHAYGPDVLAILRAVTDWRAVNYDEIREVRVRRWYRGPAFLIGDAAHAMTPNWGQGANSAMVDGLVIVHLLARARGGLETVGPQYEAVRRRFVALLQTGSRMAGVLPTWTSPAARWARDAFLRTQDRISWSKRRTLALVVGHNPREEEYLRSYERGPCPEVARRDAFP